MKERFFYVFFLLIIHIPMYGQGIDSVRSGMVDSLAVQCDIRGVILSGVESRIRECFRTVSVQQLNCSGNQQIVDAVSLLGDKNKISHTLWILEETKTRPADIRALVYSSLLKVNYAKPNFFMKSMINSYFTNYQDSNDSLARQIRLLHGVMIK